MKNSLLLTTMNDKQTEAVSAPLSNLLVLAGAGSGKTRVLVYRIAWLIEQEHISPSNILAVTFTNKAAREMQSRIQELLNSHLSGMWIGTFHGLAHRFLRQHWQQAGLPETFQIIDSDDQLRLIRRVQKQLNLDEHKWPAKQTQWFINKHKEEAQRPHMIASQDYFTETMLRVYKAYEELCTCSGLVDFSELILRAVETLQKNPDLQRHYGERFKQVLVDEFQDTNSIQYQWLKLMTGPSSNVMVVGDDDQSIYSWRGAKLTNIHNFSKDFPDVKTVLLEQNYRSTKTIVSAADALITHNKNRLGKGLWSDGQDGEQITLYGAFHERDEAHFVVSKIQDMVDKSFRYSDIAILYRSNAQSRILEEYLLNSNIPYRIYGGQRFFDRAEIKDALGYLRLICNRDDDAAFERVVNTPARGIGETTLAQIRELAKERNQSLWQVSLVALEESVLASRAHNALSKFITLVNALEKDTADMLLTRQVEYVLTQSQLMEHYSKDKSENGVARVENLEELLSATQQFNSNPGDSHQTQPAPNVALSAFLAHVALETGEGQSEQSSDFVNLMTLHAAKGLEFPVVFITGLEEDLFPHKMSTTKPQGLEEERRLCYVGMTRAMQKLFLSFAESRNLHGHDEYHAPSRFLKEIPEHFLDVIRATTQVSRPQERENAFVNLRGQKAADTGLKVGQRVQHAKFGVGIITNFEGSREQARIEVKFDNHGSKWMMAVVAKLEPA